MKRITKKILVVGLLIFAPQLNAYATMMNHRLVTSAPLLYKQIDYSDPSLSFEIEAWGSKMFNPDHVMQNLGINGKSSIQLSQQGFGDINSELLLLESRNESANYTSKVNLTPELRMYGALLHFYKQWNHVFIDAKTALINCQTSINIDEIGGGNGGQKQPNGTVIRNAQQVFTQSDWSYGKFGDKQNVTGIDNIQLMLGSTTELKSHFTDRCQIYLAGFMLLEISTGVGCKSEWLFEPQVGTNHTAVGFGADLMVLSATNYSLVAGGNYRYIMPNTEVRSFDLTQNGQWSRYLALDTIALLGTEGMVEGKAGINLFTQKALIEGRSQVTVYARLQKRFERGLFELSYNYLYTQQERINLVHAIENGFGIYNVFNGGGSNTASTATISQASPAADATPVTLLTSDLNVATGAAGQWGSSMIAARLQKVNESYTFGIGSSVDIATTNQALSTWSVWANFEVLLPN